MASNVACESQEEGAGVLWDIEMKNTASEGEDETGRFHNSAREEGKLDVEVGGRFKQLKIANLADDFRMEIGDIMKGSANLARSGQKRCASNEERGEDFSTPKRLLDGRSSGDEMGIPEAREDDRKFLAGGRRGGSRSRAINELESRVAAVETKQAAVERFVNELAESMRVFEERSRGQNDNEKIRFISKEEMVKYVEEAIGSCNTGIGCSKAYIRKFLLDKFEVPVTPHYIKKVNAAIQVGLAEKKFSFDSKHGLFKL